MSELFSLLIENMRTNPILAYTLVIIYGCFVGSFLNVVIYRLPIMMTLEYLGIVKEMTELPDDVITSKMTKEEKKEYNEVMANKGINLAFPSSRCGSCGHKIAIWHNIPVLSYILLGGKCAYCKTSYSPQYLIIELLIGAFWAYSYYMFGLTMDFVFFTLMFTALIASAAIDMKHRILPDSITFGSLFLGLYYNTNVENQIVPINEAVLGAILGYLVIYGFVKGYEKLRGIDIAMGEGDIKLYAMVGAWIGYQDLVFLVVMSTVIGVLQFIALMPFKKKLKEYQLPFGPAIILSFFLFIYYPDLIKAIF